VSKFNPNHVVAPIYDAAAKWKDRCLRADNSVFSDNKSLWTSSLLDELDQRFVKNLDEGEGDFLSKLKAQLSAGSPECGVCQTSCPLISCGVSGFRGAGVALGIEPDWSDGLPVAGFA